MSDSGMCILSTEGTMVRALCEIELVERNNVTDLMHMSHLK